MSGGRDVGSRLTCQSAPGESNVWTWSVNVRTVSVRWLTGNQADRRSAHWQTYTWGYWGYVSGSPTLLTRTAFNTRSSLQVDTNGSALKSARKHFPNDAAWCTRWWNCNITDGPQQTAKQNSARVMRAHPQQGFLGLGVVFISCSPHALFHCLLQHALLSELPEVLVSLLTWFLDRWTSVQGCFSRSHSGAGWFSPRTPCEPPAAKLQGPWRQSWRYPDRPEELPEAARGSLCWGSELHPSLPPKHTAPLWGTCDRWSRFKNDRRWSEQKVFGKYFPFLE